MAGGFSRNKPGWVTDDPTFADGFSVDFTFGAGESNLPHRKDCHDGAAVGPRAAKDWSVAESGTCLVPMRCVTPSSKRVFARSLVPRALPSCLLHDTEGVADTEADRPRVSEELVKSSTTRAERGEACGAALGHSVVFDALRLGTSLGLSRSAWRPGLGSASRGQGVRPACAVDPGKA